MFLGVRLIGLTRLDAAFTALPGVIQDKLRVFMAQFTIALRGQVKTNILDRFKVVTGEFPEAVQSESVESIGSITGRVFIDSLPWAAIQERGGKTPPHTITPAAANALAFLMPARLGFSKGNQSSAYVFAKQVNHPGSDIPERSYMRLALVQMRAPFEGGIREVVNQSISDSFSVAAE